METPLILFSVFAILLMFGVPIAFAMAIAAAAVVLYEGLPAVVVMQRIVFGVDSFPLLAVPLFLLAGELMEVGGITQRLIAFANSLVGHLRGGLAHVAVAVNMVMSGVSGSGTADAAASGAVLIPAMQRRGYSPAFAAAVCGASAVLGPIIPPSLAMIIFGAITNVSIGRLFLGGAIPGLVMGVYLVAVNVILARRRNYPREPRATMKQVVASSADAFFALLAPVMVVGGIIGGVFTPTEAAAVATIYAFVLGTLVYHGITLRALKAAVERTVLLTAKVMFIIGAASSFAWLLARYNAPDLVAEAFLAANLGPVAFLIAVNILLLFLGTVMETAAIILIATPMLMPLVLQLGIDPVHFGVMMVLNLSIGLVTPPVGLVMYVVCVIAKVDVQSFTREVAPYFIALVAALATITFLPGVVTWLPNLVFGPSRL